MALSKEKSYDYEIRSKYKHIQEREKTAITPDMDVSSESDEVKGMADTFWTDAVKKAWSDKQEADKVKE